MDTNDLFLCRVFLVLCIRPGAQQSRLHGPPFKWNQLYLESRWVAADRWATVSLRLLRASSRASEISGGAFTSTSSIRGARSRLSLCAACRAEAKSLSLAFRTREVGFTRSSRPRYGPHPTGTRDTERVLCGTSGEFSWVEVPELYGSHVRN